jgi:apolipoprotein N-acyltransferase
VVGRLLAGPRARLGLAAALGAASVTCFAPFGWWWLQLPLLAALLALAEHDGRMLRVGAAFGAGLFGVGILWLWNSLYAVGQAPLPLAFAVLASLVAIMALYHGAALALAARLAPAGAWRWLVAVPAAWTVVEWTRGWFLSGFPWFSLGYAQVGALLEGLAPVVGVHGMSFAVLLGAGALRAALAWRDRRAAAALALGAAPWLLALALAGQAWTAVRGAPLRVALVQADIAQDLKWDPDHAVETLLRYRALTLPITDVDLIVWPEAALPMLWHDLPKDYLDELTAAGRPPLVMGVLRQDLARDLYYNSVAVVSAAPQFYSKRRLVPFAEFFPVPAWVRDWLRLMSLPYADFEPGAAGQPALAVAGTRLGASVCFEDAFPDAMMAALPDAELLVNVSNDAWFGDSIGPHQHLQIARLRAREAGRPLLRATSTGITAAFDHLGRELGRAPQFAPAVLTVAVQPRTGLTPFARWRDAPLLALCLALLAVAWRAGGRGRSTAQDGSSGT